MSFMFLLSVCKEAEEVVDHGFLNKAEEQSRSSWDPKVVEFDKSLQSKRL
jgi:hypothetical protein